MMHGSLLLLLLSIAVAGTRAAEDGLCHSDAIAACKPGGTDQLTSCHARNGEIDGIESGLQSFVNKHITHSFQYLLMSSHFDNFEKNRDGFRKLFRVLSDETWRDAIDLIKYITKRGGQMDFQSYRADDSLVLNAMSPAESYEMNELESLARAVDIEKSIAIEANRLHLVAARDAEAMSNIENTFVHRLASRIRSLSGHANDLKNLITNNKQNSLQVYLFDNYLQKIY